MPTQSSGSGRPTPPIVLLGWRRSLLILAIGAGVGLFSGVVVALVMLSVLKHADLLGGLLGLTVFFGLVFGPMLAIGAASIVVTKTGTGNFDPVPVRKLILSGLIGMVPGLVIGFIAGTMWVKAMPAGDAIIVMMTQVGGIVGALIGPSRLFSRSGRLTSDAGAPSYKFFQDS